MKSKPIPVTRVTLYGDFPSRTADLAEVRPFVERRGGESMVTIYGAMRPGYLGRELLTLADVDRMTAEVADTGRRAG